MTIPKHSGLSRLADEAREAYGIELYYPVKRKGRPRRLDPNWAGIHWLEDGTHDELDISETYDAGEALPDSSASEFKIQRALGWYSAKQRGHYPRPMFQAFQLEVSSSSMVPYLEPCPACDDWSRTAQCEEHHDLDGVAGLRKGADRRAERNERRNGPVTVYSEPGPAPGAILAQLQAAYARLLDQPPADGRRFFTAEVQTEERERQLRPVTARFYDPQADPNVGRPGYHYDFARDRWVPDTSDPLGDFRAGGEVGAGQYIAAGLDSVPEELMGPTRDTWLDRITGLANFTMTIEGTFDPSVLEITGDTIQAPASTVRIEATRNDDTTP